jgi:hypothetical protein
MRNAPLPAVALAACASLLWSATQTDAGRPVRSGAPEADDRRLAEVVGLAAPASAAPRQALRCNPQARRVIEPLVLEEGFSFEVKVHYDYSCPEGTQPVVFVLAVEGSDMLRPMGFMGREVLGNVQDGLKAFVEEIDFANGSLGGMIIYTANASVRVPMGGGETTKDALIAASDALSPGGASARGAAEAVTTSKEMLTSADAPDGAFKVIVLVDVGASVGDEEEVIGTCEAARADGIHVSVMALRNAETRLMPCSEEALYRQSAREGAQDVPEKLREMGSSPMRLKQA